MRSKIRCIKNWPGVLNSLLVAPSWGRVVVLNGWLPADVAVVGEADLDVRTAVWVVPPAVEQAVNVPLAVGRGGSS